MPKSMTNSENSVEEERPEAQLLKEALEKIKKMRLEMNAMKLALAKVQKGPESSIAPTPPPGHMLEYPHPSPSTSFPSQYYFQGRNPYDSQAPPPNQNQPPPNVPFFMGPPPATLQSSTSEPLFHAHGAQYYPQNPRLTNPNHIPKIPNLRSWQRVKSQLGILNRTR